MVSNCLVVWKKTGGKYMFVGGDATGSGRWRFLRFWCRSALVAGGVFHYFAGSVLCAGPKRKIN
jgi:hypothetical protein